MHRRATRFGFLVLLAAGAAAWAQPLAVKPGLWETTTTTERRPARQPTNLDQLTPEQRAKVEKTLERRIKRDTRTRRSCLTQAQLDSGEAFTGDTHHGACTRRFEQQTASEQVAHLECAGVNPIQGRVQMRAVDPEHMTGRIEITYGAPDRLQMLTLSEVAARWLGGECVSTVNTSPAGPQGR